jgi:T5orf172 domain
MPIPGHVYILENKRIPTLVKVGKTNDLSRRLAELNSHAGMGGKWEVAGYVIVEDMTRLELETHRALREFHDNQSGGQEMFECDADTAGIAILTTSQRLNIPILKDVLPATVQKILAAKRKKGENDRWPALFDKKFIGDNIRDKRVFGALLGYTLRRSQVVDGNRASLKKRKLLKSRLAPLSN